MLDHFLQAAYGTHKVAEAKGELHRSLEALPSLTLLALASGAEKLAYNDCSAPSSGGGDCTWLDRFKGTPLFQKAFAIEQHELQLRMEEQAIRAEEDAHRDYRYSERSLKRDALGVQRKMLELELAALEEGVSTEGLEEEDPDAGLHGEQPAVQVSQQPAAKDEGGEKEAAARFRFALATQKLAAEEEKKKKSTLPRTGARAGELTGVLTGAGLGGLAGHTIGRKFVPGMEFFPSVIGAGLGSQVGREVGGRLGHAAGRTLDRVLPEKTAGLMGAAAGGLLNSAKAALPGVGKSLAQAGTRTMGAFQRGGLGAGLRTAGRSALTFAGQHPVAAGAIGAGAAGLGAGFLAGRASD